MKTYTDLQNRKTFKERFNYLKLNGDVGAETFGTYRYLNQMLYRSKEWRELRRMILIRDNGCDLGIPDRKIGGHVYIHHIEPITREDILNRASKVLDPNNVISCSRQTHNALHYGDESLLIEDFIERQPNDTIPWR